MQVQVRDRVERRTTIKRHHDETYDIQLMNTPTPLGFCSSRISLDHQSLSRVQGDKW